jgi:hypothetical protein
VVDVLETAPIATTRPAAGALEFTRRLPLAAGVAGGTVFCDSDGVVDALLLSRFGEPWMMGRLRGGRANAGTGVMRPVSLPTGPYIDFLPWSLRVAEEDYLLGRRGLAGWNGLSYDPGLLIEGPELPPEPDFWQKYGDWIIGGLLEIGGGILVFTGVGTGIGVGMMISGAGFLARGYASASMRNQDAWWAASPTVAGAIHGVGTVAAVVGGFVAVAAIPVVGSALAMGGGLMLGASMVGNSLGTRMGLGQSWGQVLGGTLADVTGVGGIYAGATDRDIATGEDLGLSEFQRGEAFGTGVASVALLGYGGYRFGRWAAPRVASAARFAASEVRSGWNYLRSVKVYRVEGAPNTRVLVGPDGGVTIVGDSMLHVSFRTPAHARYFLTKKLTSDPPLPDAVVKHFRVQRSFAKRARSAAVHQSAKQRGMPREVFETLPQIDDPKVSARLGIPETDVLGLPANWIAEMRAAIIAGSGKTGL